MGLPGSGKGTQGKMMSDLYGMHLLSMSDIIRMYITEESREKILAGKLLDDGEVIDLFSQVLNSIEDKNNCVLDGFPRSITQAEWLVSESAKYNFRIDHVIYLDASYETVLRRLQARGRADDRAEVVKERFNEYSRATNPLIDWYISRGIDVVKINAEKNVDEVNEDVKTALKLHD